MLKIFRQEQETAIKILYIDISQIDVEMYPKQ